MLRQSHSTTISTLNRLTRRYVKSDADAARLAERALRMISDDPTVLDGPNIDTALFRLVHRIAREGFSKPSIDDGQ